jgi:hypothetical protein
MEEIGPPLQRCIHFQVYIRFNSHQSVTSCYPLTFSFFNFTTITPYSFTKLPLPSTTSTVASQIAKISTCWAPCVGGGIAKVCPTDDTWVCACNNYFNTSNTFAGADFIDLTNTDSVCSGCDREIGITDGGEDGMPSFVEFVKFTGIGEHLGRENWLIRIDVIDLLINSCIALLNDTTSGVLTTSTSVPTSSTAPKGSKNAAPGTALPVWQLVVVPLAVLDGLALL